MTKPMPKALKLKMDKLATKAAFTKYKDAPGGSVSDHDYAYFCKGFQAMYELSVPLIEGYGKLLKFTDLQAKDEGLWFNAEYASEEVLQRGLRGCHVMVESVAKAALKQFGEDG